MPRTSKDHIIATYRLRWLYVEDILGVHDPEKVCEKLEATVLDARKVPLLKSTNDDICAQLHQANQKIRELEDEKNWYKESWLNDRRRPL